MAEREKICAECKKWEMGDTWGTGSRQTVVESRGWCHKTPWRKPRWNYEPVCQSFDPREKTSFIMCGQGYPTDEQLQEIDDNIRELLSDKNDMEEKKCTTCRYHFTEDGKLGCTYNGTCLTPTGERTAYRPDKTTEYAEVVGHEFRPTFASNIDHFKIRGYDAERDMVLTTAYPKESSPFDDEIEEPYLMGAFENGDYEPIEQRWSEPHTYVLHNYDMPPAPKPLEQKFCGPCCNRCQHRFGRTSNAHWCEQNYQREKCYRFKLEK